MKNIYLSPLFKFLIFFTFFHHINSDYYTSTMGLEDLLTVENIYIEAVEKYLDNVEKVNDEIESFLNVAELEHLQIQLNQNEYYGNPINVFKIIKRMTLSWKQLSNLTKVTPEYEDYIKSITLPDNEFKKPTHDDLLGAAKGLVRLQRMYKLDTKDISQGYIKNIKYSEELSAKTCFILATSLFEAADDLYSSQWFIEALEKLDSMETEGQESKKDISTAVTHVAIYEYLGAALFNTGNFEMANLMNSKLLQLDPQNQYGLGNKDLFRKAAKNKKRGTQAHHSTQKLTMPDLYANLCNGELQQTANEKRHLRCRYVSNNVAFYFIGPFKMEELNHEPFVAMYHQSVYDNEIEQIIEKVEDSFERSKVADGSDGSVRHDENRISKNSWLPYFLDDFLFKIYQRLEDITSLSLASGEHLQVANYGIGGHYAPHDDFLEDPNIISQIGDRILTALIYINDVELGGATVFPYLNLAVQPIKGSLVVWHNMHKSLEYDYRFLHAGCPVLKGSKWICNAWFHAVGQEFKRPCDLKPDGGISKSYRNKFY